MEKKLPAEMQKKEIKVKTNSKAEALKKAPDEVVARAIQDALLKGHENNAYKNKK